MWEEETQDLMDLVEGEILCQGVLILAFSLHESALNDHDAETNIYYNLLLFVL